MSKHCDICSLYFQDEYALQGHLAGKKHLKGLERLQVMERSIVVLPLPKFIPARRLIHFFQQYGIIKGHQFGPSYLIIEFYDRSSAEALLNKPIWIDNVKLNIEKRKAHNNLKRSKSEKQNSPVENTDSISYDNIKYIFEEKSTFDDQLMIFLNTVQLTDIELETRYKSVCTQMDKIFKVIFPRCKTYRFGSTQTGLGFKECDLDIYMDIGEPINESKSTSTDAWTMHKIFKEVKKIMYRMNCVFSNIILIPKAKTPIIKFYYVRTNVSCDISFKNSLGVYKSYLIKYCISLDHRLKPLILLIKYWARHFKISSGQKISNYALVLLIIFYLQQPSVNIIPPLMILKSTCQPQIINGWQVNFDRNAVLPPITNENSIPQLLHGFFFFYATFEFKSQVICPIDGMVHTESEFKNIKNLPSCMNRYKACVKEDESLKFNVNKPMCVQDPIELCHNVTTGTQFSTLDSVVRYCAIGAEICAISSKNDYKDLMKTLLTTDLKKKGKFNITISANQSQYGSNSMETCVNTTEKTKFSNGDWYSTVFNIVKDIFEKVFMVKVKVLPVETEAKQQKVEMLSDVHIEKQQTVTLHCTGTHCIWRNRRIDNNVLDPSLSCLQKEALMSEQTIENCGKEKIINRTNLDFICTFKKKDPLKVILTVSNKHCDDHVFQEFACFARGKIAEIIKRTLIHMQQFNKS
ncbi:speckle targeted PIP5K1A-regulated poly(A) polymerase-like isoform X3 [Bombus pyrosoma]|uniref:speckle targeted PIP5K1A-regulated poly(A) polymerase-like isoform X3 n=1 Tax=Bombus pyrosoma TaxID=396416 RepID=UPI001CB89C22|nr:speckle targeted PIP5K1A-regulated poly(A) polymerase-like isoform X3 [Bombus pyrosoma]XP_043605339.1 speckle targeted PIP5K1A-regulated poly(A) polymerase-like isoform X3 [Bombus pyrosoma]XP_043605340.1 speckle targeted PIP5K1A-regulated poly(A) polymerase-like isoform X3 [Bombus pyrosoma]XP_043605341.1 speckle targeted PIP5K1A-regulated poly(A) polymerase-like isoform X3 [Bombus pyrosoma]